ncbi:protein odd-skipped-related 1-like [Simochromis diagramma]|uniref:protein odd-skipped-related 1-like n=1 Tax=Simochromis diagramma TaxID=43689 RepID=UPI001A7E813F|nr:protein odd-skipped-related 1-like [Simochromis diagramma]
MFTHTEGRPYKCDLCEKTFKSPRNLRLHQQIHTRKRLYKCSYCEDDPQRLHRSSIDVLDPISDQFYEEAWMFTSARYNSITRR